MANQTLEQITDILRRFKKDDTPIEPATDLADDLRLDSLTMMDLMMELEDQFDVTIPLNAVAEIRTVGDLAAFVAGQKTGA
jgi:acyl carrier protein